MDPHLSPQCSAATEMTPAEVARLTAIPHGAHLIEPERACEIREDGHPGPHVATGQETGDDSWWLLWDGAGLRQIRLLPKCPAEDLELDEPCLLPLDHQGPHTCDV